MMDTMNKEIKNRDGSTDLVMISSEDNYTVNLNKNYKLVGYAGNKMNDKFKNSILGSDIGINSKGFASVMLVSTIIAIGTILTMYFSWRV